MSNVRILMLMAHPGSRRFGAPKVILSLGDEMRRAGHEVDYIFAEGPTYDAVMKGRVRKLDFLLYPAMALGRAAALHRSRPYDVIDISGGEGVIIPILRRLPSFRGTRFVARSVGLEHGIWREMKIEAGLGRLRLRTRRRLLTELVILRRVEIAMRAADHVIVCSRQDFREITAKHGVSPSKVSCIPHGVSDAYFDSQPTSERPDGLKDILFVGGWLDMKGKRYLRDAFLEISRRRPGTSLTIAGANTGVESVGREFPVGLHSQITVFPSLPETELKRQYGSHRLMLFPTLYEGSPLSMFEALAVGLPVVTSRVGGMADAIHDGVDGLLVAPRDTSGLVNSVLRLLGEEEYRVRMSEMAVMNARRFRWSAHARETLDRYARL